MEVNFKKEDIAALDFILKNLSDGNTPVTSDSLVYEGCLKGKNRQGDFNYFAEILESYDCCKINKKMPLYWALGAGDHTQSVYKNGGFENIFKTKIKKQSETEEKSTQEHAKLILEIQDLKNRLKDYPKTKKHATIALWISIVCSIVTVISFIVSFLQSCHIL
jgi:hypothetical protein